MNSTGPVPSLNYGTSPATLFVLYYALYEQERPAAKPRQAFFKEVCEQPLLEYGIDKFIQLFLPAAVIFITKIHSPGISISIRKSILFIPILPMKPCILHSMRMDLPESYPTDRKSRLPSAGLSY